MIRCGKSEYHNAGDSEGRAIMLWDRLNGRSPAENPLTDYPDRPAKQNKPWTQWPEVAPYRNVWGSDADGHPYYRRDWAIGQPFRTNEFYDWPWNEYPRVICTPRCVGHARRRRGLGRHISMRRHARAHMHLHRSLAFA